MRQRPAYEFDNRDSEQVYGYMEARIDALKRRIQQLEAERESLRSTLVMTGQEEVRKVERQGLMKYMAAAGRAQYQRNPK
jgi:hypothetical protein